LLLLTNNNLNSLWDLWSHTPRRGRRSYHVSFSLGKQTWTGGAFLWLYYRPIHSDSPSCFLLPDCGLMSVGNPTKACYAFTLPTESTLLFLQSNSEENCNFCVTEWATINSSDFLTPWLPSWPLQPITHNQPCAHGKRKPSSRRVKLPIISSSRGEENNCNFNV